MVEAPLEGIQQLQIYTSSRKMAEAHVDENGEGNGDGNGEESGAMNEVVNVPLHKTSLGQSEKGLALMNTWCYKNKRGKWIIDGGLFKLMIIISSMLFITFLSLMISYAAILQKRCPDLLRAVLADPCPDGWIGYRKKCYYFSLSEGNWTAGSRHCSSHNASLAVIDSQEEKSFLFRYKSPPDHWIGLQKDLGQPWRWVNGRNFTGELFTLRTEKGRRCAYLNHYAVGSSSCTREERWICRKEMPTYNVWISAPKP